MTITKTGYSAGVASALLVLLIGFGTGVGVGQTSAPAASVDKGDIGGTVTSAKGPEAGAWVIAETTDLQTRLIKIVATDDRGRFLIPDLPKANYTVWARAYRLADSPKAQTAPGKA